MFDDLGGFQNLKPFANFSEIIGRGLVIRLISPKRHLNAVHLATPKKCHAPGTVLNWNQDRIILATEVLRPCLMADDIARFG